MGVKSFNTRTIKGDAITKVVAHTTTIITDPETVISSNENEPGAVEGVKKTLRDHWFPSNNGTESEDDEDESDLSRFRPNNVMHRAYDYWKSLTQDSEEAAKELVRKAKQTRDEAAKEAKWSFFGYKKEAREALEAAEEKYHEALAAAEKAHEQALVTARSDWFRQADDTHKESLDEITHEKWDNFKAAVDSLVFNPPKYTCSPSSQYWFSRQNPAADSGWDCREVWDHPSHGMNSLKKLPKKILPIEKVHHILEDLFHQAGVKAKNSPSSTSFDSTMKSVKDYYQGVLDRVARNEHNAVEELETLPEKVMTKLNEAKYHEEQIDAWLMAQWDSVIDNAGEAKDQYKRAFRNAIHNIRKSRADIYNSLTNNLYKSINTARSNIKDSVKGVKDDYDNSKAHKVIQEASDSFSATLKDAETKIKAAPKNMYDNAIEIYDKETAHLKAKLEQLAEAAKKSGSSISHRASKTASSVAANASHSAKNLKKDANRKLKGAMNSAESMKEKASNDFGRVTASVSSMWGAATPFSPLSRAHDSYQQWLDGAKNNFFVDKSASGQQELSSFYGAMTALYLVVMARQIWLRRKCHLADLNVAEGLQLSKQKRRHSHSQHDSDSSDEQPPQRPEKHRRHSHSR
ncbi:hypothetical protein BGZ46_003622, partial [Entomortierella lignicola]